MPVISIVTPTLNQADFIEQTIVSVLGQDYSCLEYIVQDGGSSDGTVAILEKHRAKLAHVESTHDTGQANAINRGFEHSTGQIMAYMNSDDLLLPGTLMYISQYFIDHPYVDVVYGNRIVIDEKGDEIGRWVLPHHDPKVLLWADYVPQETLFWSRRIWKKTGGHMDESFNFALDWDLLIRFQQAEAKIVRLPRFFSAFRVHASQKTTKLFYDVGLKEMDRLRQRIHGRSVSEEEISRNINGYLRRSVIHHLLYRSGLVSY